MNDRKRLEGRMGALGLLAAAALTLALAPAAAGQSPGLWVAGDLHTHTYLTDGEKSQADVVAYAFSFGLDFMANGEHGGPGERDPNGTPWTSSTQVLPATPINTDGTVWGMWRWISLKDYSFPIIEAMRQRYPEKQIIQGLEWNVPSHEHSVVGIVGRENEPTPISDFEYTFDADDMDTSRTDLTKQNETHADAVAGAAWLESAYADTSYFLLNHPSRKLLYSAADIRDFNNAAPDVAFGLEGLPGHQKEPFRGGYDNCLTSAMELVDDCADPSVDWDVTARARSYGGADYMLAQVGGLMDSLWAEGRHYWVFTNSDFHDDAADADFWPGEYAKSYTYVTDRSYESIVDGLRSGDSFAVLGDLIDGLDFSATSGADIATMGQTLSVSKGQDVVVQVRFHSPAANACGTEPRVDHVDLIAGDVTGMAEPGTDAYQADTNPSATVVASFPAASLEAADGWYTATFTVAKADHSQYFRLRGTNQGVNVAGQTEDGNPLVDTLTAGDNTAATACSDLWFYSNPIFVSVD